jgi:hypothetical protein
MSTEELDQLLQAALEMEHPNEEVVLPILHELEEREKDIPVENTPEVLEILEKLSKRNTSSKRSIYKRKWIARIAAAAAVICIVVMSVVPTARAESLLGILYRWTSSVFEFFTPEQDAANPPVEIVFETDNPGLQQLYDKVTELGVTELVVPMWLPEGFVLAKMKETPAAGGTKVLGKFESGGNAVLITYRVSTNITGKVEKKETGVEVFEAGDVSHFIMDNDGNLSVTWTLDGVECILNANIPKEDIYSIIKSIYRSELS